MIIKSIKSMSFSFIMLLNFTSAAEGYPAPTVNVVAAELKSLAPISWVSGTVISRNKSQISAEVSGRLTALADLGTRVSKGDVIAQIDNKLLLIRKQESLARVKSSQSLIKYLASEVKRINSLAKRKLSSQKDVEEAIANRDIAKAELAIAQAQLAKSLQDLQYSQVKAPFDGIISQRLSNLGEFVDMGDAIVLLVETAHLEASVFAPLTAYRFLTENDSLAIESPLGSATAPIKSLVPVANSRSHLMEVRLDMSAIDWPVGLNLKAAVATGKSEEVVVVPRDALVIRRDGVTILKINPDKTAQQISVTIGHGVGNFVQVIGDVREGDLIVIRGAENLETGMTVKIKNNNKSLISGNDH